MRPAATSDADSANGLPSTRTQPGASPRRSRVFTVELDRYAVNVPGSFDIQTFKVPSAGVLSVDLTGFTGDMDLLLLDADKEELAYGGSSGVSEPESALVKFKKPTTAYIVGCNFSSLPNGTIKYVFTPK